MYFKSPNETKGMHLPSQCWKRHSRIIFYLLFVLSLIVMAVDLVFEHASVPPFYIMTNSCLIFRVIGVNCFSWLLHFLLPFVAIILIFVNMEKSDWDISKWYKSNPDISKWYIPVLIVFLILLSLHMMVFRHGKTTSQRLVRVGLHSTIGVIFIVILFWVTGVWRMEELNILLMIYMLLFLIMFLTPQFLSCSQEVVVAFVESKCKNSGDVPQRCTEKPKQKPKIKDKPCNCASTARGKSHNDSCPLGRSRPRSRSPLPAGCGCSDTGSNTCNRLPRSHSWMDSDSSNDCSQRSPTARPSRMINRCHCSTQRSNNQGASRIRTRIAGQGHSSPPSRRNELKCQKSGSLRTASTTRFVCNCNSRAGRKRVRSAAGADRRSSQSQARTLRQSKSEANISGSSHKNHPKRK